jgi:hypothetical protein
MAVLSPTRVKHRHAAAGFAAAILAGFVIGICMADSGAAVVRTTLFVVVVLAATTSYVQRRRYH